MTALIETLNLSGQRFADFALPMLIQSSLLIAFLFTLDLVLRKHVRAVIRYGLWMLVLIKLVLPPSFAAPTGFGYWLPAKQAKQLERPIVAPAPAQFTVSYSAAEPIYVPSTTPPPLPRYTPSLTWPAILLLGWATVAISLVIWLVLRARFVGRMSAQAQDVPDSLAELLERCRRQLKIKRRVCFKLSTEATSPAVCGLCCPTILIPAQLVDKLSALRIRAVLLHELSHIKRGDLWVNYAQTLLQIAYWYNPLLWLANTGIRRAREQAVDEMVMVEMGQEADAYPTTLLEVAKLTFTRSVLSLGLVGIVESKSALKERIQALLSRPIPKVARLGWKALTCIGLLGLVALPMASHPRANAVTVTSIITDPQLGAVLREQENSGRVAITIEGAVVTADKKTAGQLARTSNGPMTGILDSGQTQLEMDKFRRTKGVKIVDSLIDKVMSGRKGRFTMFVTGDNSKLQSGAVCEVQPVFTNGVIDLRVKSRVGESPNPAAPSNAQGTIDVFLKQFELESSVSLPIGSSIVLHRQEDDGTFDNDYWIVFTARLASETAATKNLNMPTWGPLWTRNFKLNAKKLAQALQRRTGQPPSTNAFYSIRDYLMQAGVDLEPPKLLFYGDWRGMLMVRGSLDDLAIVEKVIHEINESPAAGQTNYLPSAKLEQSEAVTLIQDGRVLYEVGKLDEAEAKLNQALKHDPGNLGAKYYLNLIREKRYAEVARERKPSVAFDPYARTNMIHTTKGRQAILSKLDRIRLDEVHFDSLPLSNVIKILNIEARKRDPEKSGVNFIIASHVETSPTIGAFPGAAPAIDPTTGLTADATVNTGKPVDVNSVAITIDPAITDVRLADVLDAILQVADKPIKYSVEDYAVVFSLKGNEAPPLFTRFFKVDPNTFFTSLQKHVGLAATASADEKQQAIRKFFSNLGADFQLPKTILFNDQTGALMIRATLRDLDIVESAVQTLNIAPPQITIEAKFIEVPEQVAKDLWRNPPSTNGVGTNAWTSTVTESQMKMLLKQVESKAGADILTMPRMTTLSGRQARIQVQDMRTVMKGINSQALAPPGISPVNGDTNSLYLTDTMQFGPAIDVVPTVMADGHTISMTVIPTVTEFLGYDETPSSRVPVYIKGKKEWVTMPLPKFRNRQISMSALVRDGQTLMLGNPLATSNPIILEKPGDGQKRLIVLVTPTIIDPAGNQIHSGDDIPPAKGK